VAIADSWLPASLPDPPASRIVVASLFIGWALASAGDVWPMAMQGVVFLWMQICIIYTYLYTHYIRYIYIYKGKVPNQPTSGGLMAGWWGLPTPLKKYSKPRTRW